MSLIQMAGGIAVAGAVAAGTTAFTAAAGLTNAIGSQTSFLGGKVHHNVVGAQLDTMAFTTVDNTVAGSTKVTAFTLDFDDNTPSGATVVISNLTGTPGMASGTIPDNFYCTTLGSAGGVSTCTAGTALGTYNGYYTALGGFDITVVVP